MSINTSTLIYPTYPISSIRFDMVKRLTKYWQCAADLRSRTACFSLYISIILSPGGKDAIAFYPGNYKMFFYKSSRLPLFCFCI